MYVRMAGESQGEPSQLSFMAALRKLRFWVILPLVMFASLELSSSAVLLLIKRIGLTYDPLFTTSIPEHHRAMLERLLAGRTNYLIHSSTLGWTIKPNGSAHLYAANAKGIRANREYTLTPLEHVLRISTFGDSFTHCDDVRNADTWQEIMMSTHRNLEVLNFGVSGFGLDQAFLRYQQDGAMYKSHIVLIGFHTENIYRHVNVFRPFYAGTMSDPMAKPRYIFEEGRLVLLRNPMRDLSQYRNLLTHPERVLPELGVHDAYFHTRNKDGHLDFLPSVRLFRIGRYYYLFRKLGIKRKGYYNVDSEAFKVTTGISDQFADTVLHNGSVPIFVVLPGKRDVARYRKDGTKVYKPLLEYYRAKGYRYIDLFDGFEQYGRGMTVPELVPLHYSPSGNRLVAESIWQYLAETRLVGLRTP